MSVAASPPAQSRPLLSVSGLVVDFGALRALAGIDLEIAPGEVVALAGENGAGKTTLVRCIAGDIAPTAGQISLGGRPVSTTPAAAARQGVSVVWQDLALCDNLDVASNLLLGRERRRHLLSDIRFHNSAAALIEGLGIPVRDTTRSVRSLSGGQRQLVAVARAMARKPRLLLLDEPTASLGVSAAAQVEDLVAGLRGQGTTILLACHDIDQMFRLADRIVVLRHGQVVADVQPSTVHPDDVVALLSGQQVDSSARRQLTRLHGLTDSLVSADPSSSLSLILSALGAALGSERLCIHLRDEKALICAASLGLQPELLSAWYRLPYGPGWRPGRARGRRREAGYRGERADRARVGPVQPAGRHRQGREFLVGARAGPWRAPRGHYRFQAGHRPAPAGPARPGQPVRGLCRERHRAGPAARRGHRAQPGAGNDQGDARDPCRADPGRREPRPRAPVAAAGPAS